MHCYSGIVIHKSRLGIVHSAGILFMAEQGDPQPPSTRPMNFQGAHHGAATAPHLPQIFIASTRVVNVPMAVLLASTKHLVVVVVAVECQHVPRRYGSMEVWNRRGKGVSASQLFLQSDDALRKQSGS